VKVFFSLFLAIQMLVSTAGIGIFYHYCSQDGLLISLLTQPTCICEKEVDGEACTDDMDCCSDHGDQSTGDSGIADSCCSEDFVLAKNDVENQRVLFKDLLPDEMDFLQSTPYVHQRAEVPANLKTIRFFTYKPPPRVIERYLVFESLLC
jgi:hypothetical protein